MYQKTVLDNGLRIVTSYMPGTYSVSVSIFVGAGSRYESDEMAGATHFLEHLLFKGSRSWPTAKDVTEAIEGVGGSMNASTDREMTVFWARVAQPHFERALSVLSDMIINPLIDAEELEKERQVVLEELRMTSDYPTHRVDCLIDEMLWPNQPMGRDVGGSMESVLGLSRGQLAQLRGQFRVRTILPGLNLVGEQIAAHTAHHTGQGSNRGKIAPIGSNDHRKNGRRG